MAIEQMKEKLETKPLIEMKTGIWVNREKMRSALNKFALLYGIVVGFLGVLAIVNGRIGEGVIIIILSLPLWLIKYSYYKWQRGQNEQRK